MGPNFGIKFDGSGRAPRDIQVEALQYLSDNWHKADIFALNLPVGVGKSAISQAISLATNAHVLTPSNILIDQYCATYPHKNFVKGKKHYTCNMAKELSCHDWQSMADMGACPECPYAKAKAAAHTFGSFFNPMSYWYFTQTQDFVAPRVLVVDEAHGLANQMLQMCGVALKSTQYPFTNEYKDEIRLCNWLKAQVERLESLRKGVPSANRQRRAEITNEIERLNGTLYPLRDNPQNYAIWTEKVGTGRKSFKLLHIKPVSLPGRVSRALLGSHKLILMSGTIFDTDVKELVGGRPYLYKDFTSPIPVENRRVLYRPVPFKMNYQTDPQLIANAIYDELQKHRVNGLYPNTIIHVSYALQKKLKSLMRVPILFNDTDNKDATVAKFCTQGGIFLAAGCAEGLDLKDDICRLNIIPKLLYPDLSDPVVSKRKALIDGEEWYSMQILKTLIQQIGRSTRSQADYSTAVVLDPNFARIYSKYKKILPSSFKDSITWGQ